MPILGILASSTRVAAGDFESIATTTVGAGGSSSITFSSIPSTYTHLQIRVINRISQSVSENGIIVRVNSDTGSNYAFHGFTGNGSSAGAFGYASQTKIEGPDAPGASATASIFGAQIIDILDYANTNKYKTVRILTGDDLNGSGGIRLISGLWMNTNAITSLEFTVNGGSNFVQYSHFALYGIKSA